MHIGDLFITRFSKGTVLISYTCQNYYKDLAGSCEWFYVNEVSILQLIGVY
jgi:hypothetical protein